MSRTHDRPSGVYGGNRILRSSVEHGAWGPTHAKQAIGVRMNMAEGAENLDSMGGTDNDRRDMSRMGKAQLLKVLLFPPLSFLCQDSFSYLF